MKLKEFEKPKSEPLPVIWKTRDVAGIHPGKTLDMKVVFTEGQRRALEARLGYPVDLVQISKIFQAVLEGKLGLKEL